MDLVVLLIMASVAVAVLAKLYSVLGRDVGAPIPPPAPQVSPVVNAETNTPDAPLGNASFAGLESLHQEDPSFDPGAFLQGAKSAYEMVVTAYATGDRETLKSMLEADVYANYDQAITARESKQRQVQIDIVRMLDVNITDAEIENNISYVTVEFHTELYIVEKDLDGNVLDAEDVGAAETTEQWTFAKALNSRDPNWRLSAVAAIA